MTNNQNEMELFKLEQRLDDAQESLRAVEIALATAEWHMESYAREMNSIWEDITELRTKLEVS